LDIIESSIQDGKSQLISGWSEHQPIVLKNVSYFYPDAQAPAVENLSVTIPAGKVTLILGPSGCGKTTIGRMILGFLRPSTGDVVIGGREIGDWQLAYLHSFMSYGPQNDHILDATIEENMRLAENKRKFDGEELQNALKDVNLPADATGMARRAKSLSGGEIQRLSAARILLDTSEIVVLDEPMAGIDVFTMADIAGVIEKSWGGTPRTIVIISHKLVFAALASHIVILGKNCSIIEQGRPEELLAMEGEYARLRKEALRQVG
jgi:ABC-type multidrug transport system fused ATPase/permease subunit